MSTVTDKAVSDFGSQLKKSNLKATDIAGIIKIKDGQVGIDASQAGARADQVAGQSISSIFGANPNLKAKAASNILGIFGQSKAQGIVNQAGDVYRIADGADTTRASGLTRAVGLLFKDSALGEFVDNNSVLGTALAYLQEAVALGIPDVIDMIMSKVQSDKMAKQQLIDSLLLVLLRADLVALNKIMDWIGTEAVLARFPDAMKYILAGYRFPTRSTPDMYASLRVELITTLERMKPNWVYTTRGSEQVYDYGPFVSVSAHAKILFLLDDDATYRIPILAAPQFPSVDIVALGKKTYPNMAVWR